MTEVTRPNRKPCPQTQVNRWTLDFDCGRDMGHSGGHQDRRSGKIWGTPKLPYGMRKKRGQQ